MIGQNRSSGPGRVWTALAAVLGLLLLVPALVRAAGVEEPVPESMKRITLRTHTLVPPILDANMAHRWFDIGGDAVVKNNEAIGLTNHKSSQAGFITSRVPLASTNWQMTIDFKIHGFGTLYGDGLGIWFAKKKAEPGRVFGLADNFEGFAILIDTYKNNRPGTVFPYVMAMLGDGKTPYDKANDGKANELAGCSARGLRNSKVPTKMRITYFSEKFIQVDLMYKRKDEWTNCFTIDDFKLPVTPFVSFSAETGQLVDFHEILSVETVNLYEGYKGAPFSPSGRPKGGPSRNNRPKEGRSWFKVLLFLSIIGAGGYYGYTKYVAPKTRHNKF